MWSQASCQEKQGAHFYLYLSSPLGRSVGVRGRDVNPLLIKVSMQGKKKEGRHSVLVLLVPEPHFGPGLLRVQTKSARLRASANRLRTLLAGV